MYKSFGIDQKYIDIVESSEKELKFEFEKIERIYEKNQLKVLKSFIDNKLSESHLVETSGYAYNDVGRDTIDNIFKDIFHAESAFVRTIFASGTHAIYTTLDAILDKNKKILSINGDPYDTIRSMIDYEKVDLINNSNFDKDKIADKLNDENISVVIIQRSKGYKERKSFSIQDLKDIISFIKNYRDDIIVFVDNCYGEFVSINEPTDAGADIVVGSLIKNIGGGIARAGAYVVGKKYLVDKVSDRLYCKNMGREIGSNYNENRHILQGLFLSPQIVREALKGAKLMSSVYEKAGFNVCPKCLDEYNDIVTSIRLNSKNNMELFCKAVQETSTLDSFVTPTPSDMPGYDKKVIMASGSFVTGSTIELSCDGTYNEPYTIYFQGGLSYYQIKIACMKSLSYIL